MTAANLKLTLRLPTPRSPLFPFVALSVTVHLVFTLVLVLIPTLRTRGELPDEFMVVDLVGSLAPPAPPASASAPPPEPAAAEPTEGVRLETQDVAPSPPPKKKEEKKKPEKPKPAPSVPTPSAEATGAAGQGPAGVTGAGVGPGSSIASVDLGDLQAAWYRDSVVAALRSQWVRPILEGTRETLEVTVAFEILTDGTVRNLRIDSPSGVPSLDRSALRAVADASPLPPLPGTWRDPALPARFVFRWQPGAR